MQLIDTHSHIYYDKYKDDLSEVINRATANNICNIICVGVDIDSSKKSILSLSLFAARSNFCCCLPSKALKDRVSIVKLPPLSRASI